MAKTVINMKASDIGKFNDNDLLLFDKSKDQFYRTTADGFFKAYETKLEELKKKYDDDVSNLKKENEEFKTAIISEMEKFKKQTRDDMSYLTSLVKNLLKTKGEI